MPSDPSNAVTLDVTVSAEGLAIYRYKLGPRASTDCAVEAGYGGSRAPADPITDDLQNNADVLLTLCAVGTGGNGRSQEFANATSYTWLQDLTAPFPPVDVADGVSTWSLSEAPVLSWGAATDAASGVSHYEVAVGSTPGGDDVGAWSTIAPAAALSANIGGLTLVRGERYYSSVRAVDGASNRSIVQQGDGWFVHSEYWSVNDTVRALAETDSTLYVAGDFTKVGPWSGSAGPLTSLEGHVSWPRDGGSEPVQARVNAVTHAVTSDGSGGWYLAGSFSRVEDATVYGLAHILPTGMLDLNFAPVQNGVVKAMVLSADGTTLYFAGDFSEVEGLPRNWLAAVRTSDGGLISSFDAGLSHWSSFANVAALALSPDESTLYVGGHFGQAGGSSANNLVAISTTTAAPFAAFDAPVSGGFSWSQVYDLALSDDGGTLYIGGHFSHVAGVSRNNAAAVSTANGAVITAFAANLDGRWNAASAQSTELVTRLVLSPDQSTLYLGGGFSRVNGTDMAGMAAVDAVDGSLLTGFQPIFTSSVHTFAFSIDASTLYVGGYFTSSSGVPGRQCLVALSVTDGTLRSGWDGSVGAAAKGIGVSQDGGTLYVGGAFDALETVARQGLVALDKLTGAPAVGFDAQVSGKVESVVLSSDASRLYIGGSFTSVAGVPRSYLAALNSFDGALIAPFDPAPDQSGRALALSRDDSTLYVGGWFSSMGGSPRSNIAAVGTADGAALVAFQPAVNGTVNTIALSPDETTVYIGGTFSTVGVISTGSLAAIEATTGNIMSAFAPGGVGQVWNVITSRDGATVFAAGRFSGMGGVSRGKVAALSAVDGAAKAAFDAGVLGDNSVFTLSLAADGSRLLMGGRASTIGGVQHPYFASLNPSTGELDESLNALMRPWGNTGVHAISISPAQDFVTLGGNFTGTDKGGPAYLVPMSMPRSDWLPGF